MCATKWFDIEQRAKELGINNICPTVDVVDAAGQVIAQGCDENATMWLRAAAVFNVEDYPAVWQDVSTTFEQRYGQSPPKRVEVFIADSDEAGVGGRWNEAYKAIVIPLYAFLNESERIPGTVFHEFFHGTQDLLEERTVEYDAQFEPPEGFKPFSAEDITNYFACSMETQAFLEKLAFQSRQGKSDLELRTELHAYIDKFINNVVQQHSDMSYEETEELRNDLKEMYDVMIQEKDRYMVALEHRRLQRLGVYAPLRSFCGTHRVDRPGNDKRRQKLEEKKRKEFLKKCPQGCPAKR